MQTLFRPSKRTIEKVKAAQQQAVFSYPHIGFTKKNEAVPGFDNDLNRALHGTANAVGFGVFAMLGWWLVAPNLSSAT